MLLTLKKYWKEMQEEWNLFFKNLTVPSCKNHHFLLKKSIAWGLISKLIFNDIICLEVKGFKTWKE